MPFQSAPENALSRKRPNPQHKPHGARPAERRRAQQRPAPKWLAPAIVYGVPVLAALWMHRGALGAYFTTDDLILFERARGLAPFPATAWRWLSGQAYFRLFWPVFGIEPLGWHVAGWLLHGLATGLVVAWARRLGANRATAALAGLLFGAAAHARTVVWQVTGVGESLAAVFTLLALVALARPAAGPRRGASAWHAAALLSKESVALAPLADLAGSPPGTKLLDWLRRAWLPLALSAAMWAYVLLARRSTGSLGGDAYAFGFGRHILEHLFTYTLWSADPVHLSSAIGNPPPLAWAGVAIVVLAGLSLFAFHSRSRAARAGLALWVVTLLPVLPLVNAVYEHYLYLPRAGFALALAALVAGHEGRARRWAWAGAGFLAAVYGLTATMYLGAMKNALMPELGLPRDSFLRRMELIRNASRSVRGRLGPGPVRIVVYTPPGSAKLFDTRTGEVATSAAGYEFRQNLVEATLDEGRGLRALEPAIAGVRFTEQPSEPDSGWLLATNVGDGRLAFHGAAPGAHAVMADFWERMGYAAAAASHRAAVFARDSAAAAARDSVAAAPPR